jgi:class 3 adenylate cyclase
MQSIGRQLYAFDGYTLDLIRGCLRNAAGEIQLRPKTFELLRYLVQNAGRLISKDELVNTVWPNVFVGDDSLAQCISELRNALGDRDRQIIKTIPRRGYLFAAPVSFPAPSPAVDPPSNLSDERDQKGSSERPGALVSSFSNQSGHGATTPRLAAILAADVAGYSRLMAQDEEGTHEQVKAHLGALIEPKIAEHRGRIVKNTGDGLLAEFASVVDAVRCGVDMQREMAERNAATPPEKRIEFRVGINLGDVIAEAEDIFGDGVNVAARLEGLAEAGGVLVSNTVYDHVRDRLPFTFEHRGDQQVKNIPRPVRVYRVCEHAAGSDREAAPVSP